MRGLFVTGTDTEVGKTWVSALLLEALHRDGVRAAPYKPICCGPRDDVERLLAATAGGKSFLAADEINPVWLKVPASPLAASKIENREVDCGAILDGFKALSTRFETLIVEGAGGWEVPVAPGLSMADLAVEFACPVLVVVDNKLGALNHTILTVKAILSRELPCAGVILNHCRDERDAASISNRLILEEVLPAAAPVLGELLYDQDFLDADVLRRVFAA